MKNNEKKNAALYFHLPFCRNRCGYCDFVSYQDIAAETRRQIIKTSIAQGQALRQKAEIERFTSCYLGGGTPSALPPSELEKIFQWIEPLLGDSNESRKPSDNIDSPDWGDGFIEVTIEANPADVSEDFLRLLNDLPVNRLSIGIQSFNDQKLKFLQRQSNSATVFAALKFLDRFWHDRVNLDLIYATPMDNKKIWSNDVEQALAFSPDHISLYELTLTNDCQTAINMKSAGLRLPTDDVSLALWRLASKKLSTSAYHHYEVANYCRPGYQSRHNLAYWQLQCYLGCGPAAVSTLAIAGQPFRVIGNENPVDFLNSRRRLQYEKITPGQFLLDNLIMNMRLTQGMAIKEFCRRYDYPPAIYLPRTIKKWLNKNRLEYNKHYMKLTKSGIEFLDHFLLDAADEIDEYGLAKPIALNWP